MRQLVEISKDYKDYPTESRYIYYQLTRLHIPIGSLPFFYILVKIYKLNYGKLKHS
jgi:hypothetical protein